MKLKLIIYYSGTTLPRKEIQQEPQPTEKKEALQHTVSSAKMNQVLSDAVVKGLHVRNMSASFSEADELPGFLCFWISAISAA